MSEPQYIVVENAGMVGETDVGKFGAQRAAWAYIERAYTASERDPFHKNCLCPDVCREVDGVRTYDI